MGSFRATLTFAGNEYDVLYSSYELHRDIDHKGLVASGVYGGSVTIRIQSTSDSSVIEAMVNSQFKPVEGKITYKKVDEDAKMKEVEFKNAYIVRFKETFDANGDNPATIVFTVSAEELIMGNATHLNRWPQK